MKTYEELARGALARAEEEKKRRKKQNRIAVSSVALGVAVTAAVLILRHPWPGGKAGDMETLAGGTEAAASQTVPDGNAVTQTPEPSVGAVPVTAAQGTEAETEAASVPVSDAASAAEGDGDSFGGESAYTGAVTGYVVTGDAVTEAEAEAYFAEHLNGILTSLSASGVNASGAQLRTPGYSHMTLGQTGDVRLDFCDYQLWQDGTLLAIITLYKLDGEISATPSFGAPWFDSFAAFLRQHRGEKLLFFYNGFTELVLTPENVAYAPVTGPCENPGLDYDTLFCDEIAFVP